ncbi:MAG: DUF2461 domain-containing protein [Clostridia bacterium]|nr:DUF2461 domain-containing protein [Clostridia bacterium]
MRNYKGISAQDFFMLAENRFMNSKSFYEEKKELIKQKIILPMRALTLDLNEFVLGVDGEIYTNPVHQVSKVRRDTRFSVDKSLYRENLWVGFSRYKKEFPLAPSFWLEIFQNGYTCGIGFFYSTPHLMEIYRKEILANKSKFGKIIKSLEKLGIETYGDTYKKSKAGDVPPALAPYYNKKNVGFFKFTQGLADIESETFVDKIIEIYKEFVPMYKFLLTVSEKEITDRINAGGM